MTHQQNCHDYQCDQRNYDEESVVALERSKRCAGIRDVNQVEEIRHYTASFVRAYRSQYPLLRHLVQSVERKREKEDELHVDCLSFRAKRSGVEESRGNVERSFTGCLDFARHDDLMRGYHA